MTDFTALLDKVANGRSLDESEATAAFAAMATGQVSDIQVAGFLGALQAKEPTAEELTAAVREMRGRMIAVSAPSNAIDILGTGGDGKATYNISTAAAFVVAAAGVPVAKQGNRAFSSQCGSADVLTSAGAVTSLTTEQLEFCLAQLGLCFLFAPDHHPALRHVHPVRRGLRVRTVFNLMGPLMNAANVRYHLVGAYDRKWLRPMAQVLGALGSARALVVSSAGGMDEFALSGPTHVAELVDGNVREWTFEPDDVGLACWTDEDLRGGDPASNATSLRTTLAGAPGPFRDVTAVNAGAALYVAGRAADITEGTRTAQRLLDSGEPARLLERYVAVTNELVEAGGGVRA